MKVNGKNILQYKSQYHFNYDEKIKKVHLQEHQAEVQC